MRKAKRNPRRRGESKICDKAKRLVKRKKTRPQAKALFSEAARKGKPCRSRKRKSTRKVVRARQNPYREYFVVGFDTKGNRWYLTDHNSFTKYKRFASAFRSVESAKREMHRIKNGLPYKISHIALRSGASA